ncbi:hypothetical protein B0H21DRAFT_823282 [Amylocystis lapponica]|nr:hypothetical protein B0H21DRAFT_823282 [Amylocystis lapponica]
MLYAGLHDSDPFSEPVHAGFGAASQVPSLIILATKNNVISWLVGCGYEQLNFLHRFVGRVIILAVNVHSIGYKGSFWTHLAVLSIAWGFIGLIVAHILFLLSTSIARQLCYPVFYVSHQYSSSARYLCAQEPWPAPYVIIAVVFYASFAPATPSRTCPAGQHVHIKVLSLARAGWLSRDAPFHHRFRQQGSRRRGSRADVQEGGRLDRQTVRAGQANGLGRNVRAVVDGPYGGPGHAVLASSFGGLFVAGGSGTTSARVLMYLAAQGKTCVKAIELVWSIPDPGTCSPPCACVILTPPLPRAAPPALHERDRGVRAPPALCVCSLLALWEEVAKAVRGISAARVEAVGGIELQEDIFRW